MGARAGGSVYKRKVWYRNMKTLDELALQYGTDKNSKFHNYCPIYERFLAPLRDKPVNLLEVGVYRGGSLRMWQQYFQNGKIRGVDINRKCRNNTAIPVSIGDAGSPAYLEKVGERYGPFDILIDDGSHIWTHQILFYKVLWQFLRVGGIMAIEDMHTSYGFKHKERAGCPRPSEFFSEIAQELCRHTPKCPPTEMHFSRRLLIMVK